MTNSMIKGGGALQQWLNQFSDKVDYKRFQRGMQLYNAQSTLDFQLFPNHFECDVQGNTRVYSVTGEYNFNGDYPDLKSYKVTCSCPDDNGICKHAVCATIHFILSISNNEADTGESTPDARETLIEDPLNMLKERVRGISDSIETLSEGRKNSAIENTETIKRMHTMIVDVMDHFDSSTKY